MTRFRFTAIPVDGLTLPEMVAYALGPTPAQYDDESDDAVPAREAERVLDVVSGVDLVDLAPSCHGDDCAVWVARWSERAWSLVPPEHCFENRRRSDPDVGVEIMASSAGPLLAAGALVARP